MEEHPVAKNTVKIGVYGSYKKGFHNHEALGEKAKFLGMSTLTGVMYLVDGNNPYPLFYTDSVRPSMVREYLLELYEIELSAFNKIKDKECRENGRQISVTVDNTHYFVFVTNKKDKPEPEPADYCKAFNKMEFSAYIGGDITIHSLDTEAAEKTLREMFDDAADILEREKKEDTSLILRQLSLYINPKGSTVAIPPAVEPDSTMKKLETEEEAALPAS